MNSTTRVILILTLSAFYSLSSNAQNKPEVEKTDSTKVYKDIETFAKKTKFTKFLHRLVFKPVIKKPSKKKKSTRLVQQTYKPFEGKIIRSVSIMTLEPFGTSLRDTGIHPHSFIQKAGNTLHIKTRKLAIRQLLLFHKDELFDSLKIKETERLIRSQRYIRDVFIYPSLAAKNSDSVDIYIRALDVWSITPHLAFTTNRLTLGLNERNLAGMGHQFSNDFTWYHTTGDRAFESFYYIPNINRTYINTTIDYFITREDYYSRSINIERPFYSPLVHWAGGTFWAQQKDISGLVPEDTFTSLTYKRNIQDYWMAKSWQISKGSSEIERTTNFIMSLRYLRFNYFERPDIWLDTLGIYNDEENYLFGSGISTRTYVQDRYVFDYGVTEDIPTGKAYWLVTGFRQKNGFRRMYFGFSVAFGEYLSFGYLNSKIEYSTFMDGISTDQGIVTASVNYFSPIIEWGNWRFRQFIKPEIAIGIRRLPNERLTLNDNYGIRGFDAPDLYGTQRFLLTLQTQAYAPWNVLGFRFGPYVICALGMLGTDTDDFSKSRLYSQFGFGFLIKNEFLVLNSFQVSFAYYPLIPGSGANILKFNPYKTDDYQVNDFNVAKPGITPFR